jgi:nucleotidyltransferase/DNA polymerase involved in DNA repair
MNTFVARIRYNGHPLNKLPGIGRHTPKAMAKYGIHTIEQFALFTENEVIALLGNSGRKLLQTAKQLTTA